MRHSGKAFREPRWSYRKACISCHHTQEGHAACLWVDRGRASASYKPLLRAQPSKAAILTSCGQTSLGLFLASSLSVQQLPWGPRTGWGRGGNLDSFPVVSETRFPWDLFCLKHWVLRLRALLRSSEHKPWRVPKLDLAAGTPPASVPPLRVSPPLSSTPKLAMPLLFSTSWVFFF